MDQAPKQRKLTYAAIGGALLLVLGLAQMAGDLLGLDAVKGIAAATAASPAPKVFSSAQGLETYSTRFFIEWSDTKGERQSIELTPELCARMQGPYNRRNVFGAALAYGPVLERNPKTRDMFRSVVTYALTGDRPLLRELGIDPASVAGSVQVRYEPVGTSDFPSGMNRIIRVGD